MKTMYFLAMLFILFLNLLINSIIASPILENLYLQSLVYDDEAKQVLSEEEIERAKMHEATALFLPQVNFEGLTGYSSSDTVLGNPNIFGLTTPINTQYIGNTNVYGYELKVEQVLLDLKSVAILNAAAFATKASEVKVETEHNNLALHVAKNYFDVLSANDQIRFLKIKEKALLRAYQTAQRRFHLGLGIKADIYEAYSRATLAQSELMAAENAKKNAQLSMEMLAGQPVNQYPTVSENFSKKPIKGNTVKYWENLTTNDNLGLIMGRIELEAEQALIQEARMNFMPTVGLEGTYSYGQSNIPIFTKIKSTSSQVILAARWNLFSGGLDFEKTKEKKAQYHRDFYKYAETEKDLILDTQRTVNNINTLHYKLKSDKAAIQFAKTANQSVTRAYELGTETIQAVLDTQETVYETAYLYQHDFYDYILLNLELKNLTGRITLQDLHEIDQYIS